jgi:nucleotide-binding universal stress UspA family protein
MSLIVVGTDGSETAGKAVAKAIEIAKQGGYRLAVVSAYKPITGRIVGAEASGEGTAWMDGLSDAHVDAVLRAAVELARSSGVAVESHPRKGDPADALLEVAEEQDADMVVVGNKGMTGARRFLLGSVPNKVAHHASCSVLIVRTT